MGEPMEANLATWSRMDIDTRKAIRSFPICQRLRRGSFLVCNSQVWDGTAIRGATMIGYFI